MHSCLLTLADGHKSEVVNVHRNRICLPSPAPSRSLVWIESWSKEIFLDHIFEKQPCVPSFVQVYWGGNLGLEVALPSYHPRKDDGWTPQFLVICLILHDDGQGLGLTHRILDSSWVSESLGLMPSRAHLNLFITQGVSWLKNHDVLKIMQLDTMSCFTSSVMLRP